MRIEGNRIYVSFHDVVARRIRVVLPPAAKIKIAQRAGAPWAEAARQQLHPGQIECLSRRERLKIVHGGSGWGKSAVGGLEAGLEYLLPYTETAVLAARFGHVDSEWKYVDKMMQALFGTTLRHAMQRWDYRNSPSYYSFFGHSIWDSKIQGFSLETDEGRSVLGRSFNRVLLGEGANVPIETLERKIYRACDRSLMGQPETYESGWITAYTTPNQDFGCSSAEWDRVLRETRGKPQRLEYGAVPFTRSVWIKEASVLENPAYSRPAFNARQKAAAAAGGASQDAFDEQMLGKRTFGAGRVYSDFRPEMVVRAPDTTALRQMRFAVGCDPGEASFGIVLVGLDRVGRVWVLGGVYAERQRLRENCRLFREEVIKILGDAFGTLDYSRLKEVIYAGFVDPAAQCKLELADHLEIEFEHPARQQGKFELLPTIDQMRELMKSDRFCAVEGFNRLMLEMQRYVWKKTKLVGVKGANSVREPIRGFDHILDAIRYASIPLAEAGPTLEDPPAVSSVDAYNRELSSALHGPLREMMRKAEEQGGWSV